MRAVGLFAILVILTLAPAALAQTSEPDSRQAAIEQAESEKAKNLHPYVPSRTEKLIDDVENALVNKTTDFAYA